MAGLNDEQIRKLIGNPPKHPLSREVRGRIIAAMYKVRDERRHVSSFMLPFARIPVYARAAAAALTVLLCANIAFSPAYPVVSNATGTVKIYRSASNTWVFADPGRMKLAKNDIVKTFGDGSADVIMGGVYHVRVKGDSEIRLARTYTRAFPGETRYELAKGKAFAFYKKKEKRRSAFNINTPEADVSVTGTDFMVASIPAMSESWVGVLDGVVTVTGRGLEGAAAGMEKMSVAVKPGEKTVVRAGEAPAKPFRLLEADVLEMQELYRIGVKPQVALLISTGPTRTRELLSVATLFISSEKKGALPARVEQIVRSFAKAREEKSRKKLRANIAQMEDVVNTCPDPKYNVQFLLFIGAYYEYIDEHEQAIRTFRRTIDEYPESALASIAQCAIGLIYEEKIGDVAGATQAYQAVLSNYPSSPEAEEASAGLKRLAGSGGELRGGQAGPSAVFSKYRKDYAKGTYRTVVSVTEGKVIVADYDGIRGPDYKNGKEVGAGQRAEVTAAIT